jgi:iron complex outermembrane receptor protein
MRYPHLAAALAMAIPCAPLLAQTDIETRTEAGTAEAPAKTLGVVTITSGQPTSLPTQIPTTFEGATREQIEATVNAFDSEDALKYFPSLLVRKRYIGDYNHAMLSSRASGTGQSPRSMVYADGIPLSNLLGSGVSTLSYAPRWNMVAPDEIERVDVMYGPFSAAYPGNSVGAVVDYVTRMPSQFEASVRLAHQIQPFKLYSTDETYNASQGSFSLGNKDGSWSWSLHVDRTDSNGQPLTFPTAQTSSGAGGTVVSGAVPDRNTSNAAWYILGTATQYHSVQDHAKLKLAYDISSTLRATYQLGIWQNDAKGRPQSYLRDAAGNPVYSGVVNIDGRNYTLGNNAFALTNEQLLHLMHGFSLKSNTRGIWDWEFAASLYDYNKDEKRTNIGTSSATSTALPSAYAGGQGAIYSGKGSGWNTLALKGTWRPDGAGGPHIVDMGAQQDSGQLSYVGNSAADWIAGAPGSQTSSIGGKTTLQSLWGQDAWTFAPRWKTVLGLRAEQWAAFDGRTYFSTTGSATNYGRRDEFHLSPKLALLHQWRPDTVFKVSLGRAVRMPTLSELYGATSCSGASCTQYVNDANLKPEKSWTTEVSLEKDLGQAWLRATLFVEETRDAIYSQNTYDATAGNYVNRVGNVDRILTKGVELAGNGSDIGLKGLDLNASLTYAESFIIDNTGYVSTQGDTIGKWQPNVPQWRATLLASYRMGEHWTVSGGVRYSGKQYRTLNNVDVNGTTYMGVSEFLVADLRVRYRVDRHWTASFGIDNVNNDQYWNFHPYPQRSYSFELNWKY